MKNLPIVAIIGKTNSGKSTLFNRITGSRKAITHETPGVTRDRLESEASWNDVSFTLIDTGGFGFTADDPLQDSITERIVRSVESADVIIFLTDSQTGPTSEDDRLVRRFRAYRDRMILAVNKVEKEEDFLKANEFFSMGFPDIFNISALHGTGIGDLLDMVAASISKRPVGREKSEIIRVGIIGKPNVGKSTLLNALAGEDLHIVSSTPGTTRDAIEIRIQYHGREIILIDTAGVRRRSRTEKGVDAISSLKSIRSVESVDVVLVMLDASQTEVSRQDARVASIPHKERKGVIILLNKWDKVEKDSGTLLEYEKMIRNEIPFLAYAPIMSISATEGTRLSKIIPLCLHIQEERSKKVTTSRLNDLLEEAAVKNPPKFYKTGTGKVYYGTQTGINPPTFTLFVNKTSYFPRSYIRYLNNMIRKRFTFEGTAVRILLRSKE
jgi:GTP-binding protein